MTNEKTTKAMRRASTFDVQIASTLFSENPTDYEKEHKPIIETKMKELGGNWKRLTRNNCSYYVSDLGKIINKDGAEHSYRVQNNGYVSWRYTTIHRLVCFAFGKIKSLRYDPKHPEEIDHIDEDKTNNALTNLRVVSHKDNVAKRDRYGFKTSVSVDVYEYDTSKFIATYNSYAEAANALGVSSPAIYYSVNQRIAQTHGYAFRKHGETYTKLVFKNKGPRMVTKKIKKNNKTITIKQRVDHPRIEMWKDGELYKTVSSFADISKITGSDRHVIADRLHNNSSKPLRGFIFKYEKGE